MKKSNIFSVEQIWNNLLSRQPDTIQTAYQSLTETNRKTIHEHLERMISEEGWHPEQKRSAEIALNTIQSIPDNKV